MPILLYALFFLGGISGQATTEGVPVPGATVTATQGENRIVTITDQQGKYTLPASVDDSWTVQIEMQGFYPCKGAASTASWELKLLPFEEMHADIIKPEPHNAAILETKPSPDTRPAFAKLDVNVSKHPGLNEQSSEKQAASGLFDNLSSEDLNQRAMPGSLINGSVNNGADSPFALPSAFGNNRFFNRHFYSGNAGITLDSSGLDARPYSLVGQNNPKSAYSNYAASLNFGGILAIPHVIRNGPYFFLNYEHKQNRNAAAIWGRVPTAAERSGDFSQTMDAFGQRVQLKDPNTQLPLSGNIIAPDPISSQALSLMKLFPLPNFDDNSRTNYQRSVLDNSNQDNVSLRLQNNPASNSKNRFSGIFDFSRGQNRKSNLYSFLDATRNSSLSVDLNWQTSIGRKFSSEFRFKISRQTAAVTPYFANRLNVSGEAVVGGNNQDALNWGPPNLEFSGSISPLTDVPYSSDRIQNSVISYAGSWYNNKHNITFGAGVQWNQFNLYSQQDARGTFKFTGNVSGYDFADFLFGIPETSSIAYGNADKYFRQKLLHANIGDNWKIGRGFTINAGLRWEYETPINELQGRLVNLNISPDFSSAAPTVGNDLIRPDKTGIQPRIGLAWRPGISSLVVRAGYGVYRDTNVYKSIAVQMAQQSPLSKSMIEQYNRDNPQTMRNVFTSAQPLIRNTFAVDSGFRVGYVQNWQLSIQNNLPAALQITLIYMGIKGTHLPQESLPNTFPSGALSPSGYAYLTSNGSSIRHAGTLQLRRRLRSGLAGNLQYTFSKSLDDAPLMAGGRVVAAGEGGTEIAQNWLDMRAERALSNFDQRHQVTAQMQYTSGMGVRGGALIDGWKGMLLKDWGLQWELKAGSGFPQTPIYYAAMKGIGVIGNLRPNCTGASIQAPPPGLFLNPDAFRIPASDQWGNAGRNSIRGPAQFELNASLGRSFRLHGKSLDVRVDATNVLNHVTYTRWNAVVNNVQFGLPSSVAPMRTLRLFLRLRFGQGGL
jgi:trimeric autotransporter adhesin